MIDRVPTSIHESALTIAGHTLRIYRLDDGRCVVNADDMNGLVADMDAGRVVLSPDEAGLLMECLRGGSA